MQEKHRIKVADIKEGMKIAESIYASSSTTNMMIVRKNTLVDESVLKLLKKYEVRWVDVFGEHVPGSGTRIKETTRKKDPVPEEKPAQEVKPAPGVKLTPGMKLAPKIKLETIPEPTVPDMGDTFRKKTIKIIRDMFTAFQTPGVDVTVENGFVIVERFEKMLEFLVPAVTRDISGLIHIQDLKSYDDYPYNHSLAVTMLSIATGQALGLDIDTQLRLARCAVLHDLGKPYVPRHISEKRTKLSKEEFDVIKEHAANGAAILKKKGYGDSELWNGVMFHHEKVNGMGYPKGLRGNDIPLFSKIIAVADMYDAVTSYRPHRDAVTPSQAFEMISSEAGTSFDFDIVMAFTKNLMLYPVGIALNLSDGRVGIVTNNENVLRPTVEIRETGELLDLSEPKNLSTSIVRMLGRVR